MRGGKLYAVVGACLLAAGVALYLTFFRDSEEERIRKVLTELTRMIEVKDGENVLGRTARLRSKTQDLVEDDVRVTLSERSLDVRGRKDFEDNATRLGLLYQKASCELTRVKVRVDPNAATGSIATVDADAVLTAVRGGERKADRRAVHFLLRKDGGWRVSSIEVAAPRE